MESRGTHKRSRSIFHVSIAPLPSVITRSYAPPQEGVANPIIEAIVCKGTANKPQRNVLPFAKVITKLALWRLH